MKSASSSFNKFRSRKRKTVRLSQESLVQQSFLTEGQTLPRVFQANVDNLNLESWAKENRELVAKELGQYGGILFRGFRLNSLEQFEDFIAASSSAALSYTERSSPRSQVSGNIYTSTDYPPSEPIFLHNEQSYNLVFPNRIIFYCVTAAPEGGETPIADSRQIYQRLDPEIRQRFIDRSYRYVRNFGAGFGLSWEEAFQTEDQSAVEEYCRENEIDLEWKDGGKGLRTSQLRRVLAKHPQTGELSWFNHLTFFHIGSLTPHMRDAMLNEFALEDLPNNTYYGDGTPIEPEVMAHLRELYEEETVTFPWQEGDVLLLDNILTCHGRKPFSGARKVVVGMSDPVRWADV